MVSAAADSRIRPNFSTRAPQNRRCVVALRPTRTGPQASADAKLRVFNGRIGARGQQWYAGAGEGVRRGKCPVFAGIWRISRVYKRNKTVPKDGRARRAL